MWKPILLVAAALASPPAHAATYLLDVRGTVESVSPAPPADWAGISAGAPVHVQYVFDTQVGSLSSDGATWVRLDGLGLRARLWIGGRAVAAEYPGAVNGGMVLQSDGALPAPGPADVFTAAHVSTDGLFFSDPTIPAAHIRLVQFVDVAPGDSNLVAGPVTALGQRLNFAVTSQPFGQLFDGTAVHPSSASTDWAFGPGAWLRFSIGTASIQRCHATWPWIAALTPWPAGELECR